MRPRTDGRPYKTEASIDPDLCVSCGICLGSCSPAALALSDVSMLTILSELRKRRTQKSDDGAETYRPVLLCEKSLLPDQIDEARQRVNAIVVPCIGAIHPTIIDRTMKAGFGGILLAGCKAGDCHYRLGNRWLQERHTRQREPYPKPSFDPVRVRFAEYSPAQGKKALLEMERFSLGMQNDLSSFTLQDKQRPAWIYMVSAAVVLIFPALLIFALSGRSTYSFYRKEESLLIVSFKYSASPQKCRERSMEELEKIPEHMRTPLDCTRARLPIALNIDLDGKKRLEKTYQPTGLWSDGPVFVYEKFKLNPGDHLVGLTLQEKPSGSSVTRTEKISLKPGHAWIFDIVPEQKK